MNRRGFLRRSLTTVLAGAAAVAVAPGLARAQSPAPMPAPDPAPLPPLFPDPVEPIRLPPGADDARQVVELLEAELARPHNIWGYPATTSAHTHGDGGAGATVWSTTGVTSASHQHPINPDGTVGSAYRSLFETWETRGEPDGTVSIVDSYTGDRFTGPPTVEMLEALERSGQETESDLWARGYLTGREQQLEEIERLDVPSAVVAGALYDFMGWLTTRDDVLTLSSRHEPHELLSTFSAWAAIRGLSDEHADVKGWQGRLSSDA